MHAVQFLVALQQAGKLTCVISQNVDGLHTRSGITRDRLAELHGSCFVETCGRCRREYVREFELDTVGAPCVLWEDDAAARLLCGSAGF